MRSFTQEERLTFPAAEAPLTSLAEKIEQLNTIGYISKDTLDKKVRQSVACKQSCHKLSQVINNDLKCKDKSFLVYNI